MNEIVGTISCAYCFRANKLASIKSPLFGEPERALVALKCEKEYEMLCSRDCGCEACGGPWNGMYESGDVEFVICMENASGCK